jgi:hypothetical protein
LNLSKASWVISTLPDWSSIRALMHALHAARWQGSIAAAARDSQQKSQLVRAGVTLILNPFEDAADFAAQRLAADLQGAPQAPTTTSSTSASDPNRNDP